MTRLTLELAAVYVEPDDPAPDFDSVTFITEQAARFGCGVISCTPSISPGAGDCFDVVLCGAETALRNWLNEIVPSFDEELVITADGRLTVEGE